MAIVAAHHRPRMIHVLRLVVTLPARIVRGWRYRRAQRAVDRRYGSESLAPLNPDDFTTRDPARAFAYAYHPSPVLLFEEAIAHVPTAPGDLTFVDLGCGKGMVLMLAAQRGFSHVIGVELEPNLCAQARINLARFQLLEPGAPPIALEEGDAAKFAFPPGPLLIYLYNPFGPELMVRVLERLQANLGETRRPCWVVYVRPLHHTLMMESGFLTLHAQGSDRTGAAYAVYAATV